MKKVDAGNTTLPPNFVVYDHESPSPLFPAERVAYIESINADFSEEDLQRIRRFERFALNLNTGLVGNGGIPGLRKEAGRDHLYVGRFSDLSWRKFINIFYSHIPDSFSDKPRSMIEMLRVKLPNGDRFYPITFFGDLVGWRDALVKAAEACGTFLAEFERGSFRVSNGQIYRMAQLEMAWKAHGLPIPKSW